MLGKLSVLPLPESCKLYSCRKLRSPVRFIKLLKVMDQREDLFVPWASKHSLKVLYITNKNANDTQRIFDIVRSCGDNVIEASSRDDVSNTLGAVNPDLIICDRPTF